MMDNVYNGIRQLSYAVMLVAFGATAASAQEQVQGTVTDSQSGNPLSAVMVSVEGSNVATVTDAAGDYTIPAAADATLTFSQLGYSDLTVDVDGRAVIDVQLQVSALGLDEIVVVGYTRQTRRSIAGSVSTVQGDDLQLRQATQVEDALRGRVAGVNVRQDGRPGTSARVDIRGRAFTEDNSPLYVVDGMYLRDLRNVNPNDIESVQVLKDASAASQYGAQAANGVVIITTRQGSPGGGNQVNIRSSYAYSEFARYIPMKDARGWADITRKMYEGAQAIDSEAPTVPGGVLDVENGVNTIDTDWQRAYTQPGHLQDHILSVSGGTDSGDATYFISGGYTGQKGTIMGTGFDRGTLRVNSQIRRGRFTIGENLQLSRSDRDNQSGSLGSALGAPPPIPVRNTETGEHGNDDWGHGTANYPSFFTNPVAAAHLIESTTQRNEAIGTVFGEVELPADLTYRLNVGFRYNDDKSRSFGKTGTFRQNHDRGPATLSVGSDLRTSVLLEHQVTYNRVFGPHNINATALYSQNRQNREDMDAFRRNFPNESFRVLSAGTEDLNNSEQHIESRLNSYLARVSYSLADRYIAEASYRRDGSSRFGPENRWGDFWAASLGWVMSDEAFFQDLPLIGGANFFRLRGSYGTQGNQDFADYEWQAIVSTSPSYIRGPEQEVVPGAISRSLGNPTIRWQDNTMQNYGVDMGLFDDRLSVTVEYFKSESGGLLARVPLVPSVGSNQSPFENAGSIMNSGFEFTVQHSFSREGFQLNSGINLATLDNKVLQLGTADEDIIVGSARTAVGLPMGHFWMYRMCGIFQSDAEVQAHTSSDGTVIQAGQGPGDICWVDHNDDGQIDDQDKHYLGSPWPTFEGGFFFDGAFRDFDFSVGFRGAWGHKVDNSGVRGREDMDGDSNWPAWLEPWTPENPSTTTPRAVYGGIGQDNSRGPSNRWLEDGSYLRLQNVQVGYQVPTDLLNRARMPLQSARVYLNLQDVYTFTDFLGYDPEFTGGTLTPGSAGTGYPNPRSFTFGVNVGL